MTCQNRYFSEGLPVEVCSNIFEKSYLDQDQGKPALLVFEQNIWCMVLVETRDRQT